MRAFDWGRHEVEQLPPRQRRDYGDGRRVPLVVKLAWLPFAAWFAVVLTWSWQHPWVPGADERIGKAFVVALLAVVACLVIALVHVRVHRPVLFAGLRDLAHLLMIAYWADKAVHALVRHYRE